ncbi:hypothetical protein ADK53_02415 [Streptomyces sp. WM6373]|nr:hypothetical protein ADK53_02415 [Streptomyces sp. WM6373]
MLLPAPRLYRLASRLTAKAQSPHLSTFGSYSPHSRASARRQTIDVGTWCLRATRSSRHGYEEMVNPSKAPIIHDIVCTKAVSASDSRVSTALSG